MPTINQLIRSPRSKQIKRNKVPALESCPQKEVFALVCIQQHQKSQIQL